MNQVTSSNAWNEENAQFLEKVTKLQIVTWISPFAHKREHKLSIEQLNKEFTFPFWEMTEIKWWYEI